MKGFNPLEPSGVSPEAVFAQSVNRKVHGPEMRLNNSATVKVRRTTKGIFLVIKPQRGGAPTTPCPLA